MAVTIIRTASLNSPVFTGVASFYYDGTARDVLSLNNNNIINVGNISIADPGAGEGISWTGGNGWKIYESPDDLGNTAGNLQFVQNTTRRMTIDTSGRVTIPSQPLFSGTHTAAIDVTNVVLNSTNCFNQIDYNIGNNFVASTGRFTAQVSGYYEASAHFGSVTANTVNVRIRKNGISNTGPLVEVYNQSGTGSTNNYARAIIFLAVDDYIDFEAARLDAVAGVQHKRFLIRLLQ